MSLLIESTDCLLLDLDGTVYHGANPIPEAVQALSRVRAEHGEGSAHPVHSIYVTNNASRGPQTVAQALCGMGVECAPEDILTSAQAGVRLLAQKIPAGSAVFVLGTDSLKDLVREAGFRVVASADDQPAGVVHGHSPLTAWADLAEACLAINRGAVYVATNMDTTLPAERGMLPGNGSMVAALTSATGVVPESAGKPAGTMFFQAAQSVGSTRPLGVGDRLNTDIAGGVAAGMPTFMVLTGVSGHVDVVRAVPAQRPTYIAESMLALFEPAPASTPGPKPGWQVSVEQSVVKVEYVGAVEDVCAHDALLAACHAAWESGQEISSVVGVGDVAREVVSRWR